MKIIYEQHPVTPERKAELRAQGYRIVDAKFAPPSDLPTREDIAKMPKAEVIEWLVAHGVEAPTGPVADLRAALIRIMFAEV